ncbi:2-octaprenyl-6-methoxyphenyl hydroxylase [Shewanella sp. JM162201]|uniref:2-octaprenyl-6-methoxyphenyl hydroxylase n=2 Tax=Shewanella jiangmenensis TaxID=2837387 RepID=A0ABS5UZC3_9GAMM|nr:2-octaprenyl-6-methoxyphenyl hydroxylase [Shewanella jiangmenensis]
MDDIAAPSPLRAAPDAGIRQLNGEGDKVVAEIHTAPIKASPTTASPSKASSIETSQTEASQANECAHPTQTAPASQSSGNEVTQFDVVIVGGAMAGCTLALALDGLNSSFVNAERDKGVGGKAHDKAHFRPAKPLRIALIEAKNPAELEHPGFDARAIAVAEGSVRELSRLGVWRHLAHLGTPIRDIHVSDRGHFGMTELNADAFALPFLGQVVELEAVGQALFAALEKTSVSLFCPASLASLEAGQDEHLLVLDNGQQIKAKLVVAADGLGSAVRQHFRLPLEQVDFGQSAVIANVAVDKAHDNWAWERFTDTGPLALLPMAPLSAGMSENHHARFSKERLSLVWALPPDEAQAMRDCSEQTFIDALQRAFGFRAGKLLAAGNRYSYELKLSWMPRPIHHRCVFVGNAAQTLHPIAGQGFNLGLRDIVDLLTVLEDAIEQGGDVGDIGLLHRYLNLRDADRRDTLLSIESLVRGFSNQHWPLVAGRNLALRLLSWCPPLKAPLASRAMGWRRGARLNALSKSPGRSHRQGNE